MQKNKHNTLNIFVKKITEKWEKVLTKDELMTIWTRSWWSESRFSYALNFLWNHKQILRVARWIYIINFQWNFEELYWQIIDKIITLYTPHGAIIGWEKSLELHMMNFLSPEKLILYAYDFSSRIRLLEWREIHFRQITSWEKTHNKNFFSILKKFSHPLKTHKHILLPKKEISLLEALSIKENLTEINEITILQFLWRNHNKMEKDTLHEITKYKYIRAINRLRQITKQQSYDTLYQTTLEVIKNEGGWIFLSL